MPKTTASRATTITVRVGPNTKADIHAYAKAREMTASEFVRYCVRIYMEHTPLDKELVESTFLLADDITNANGEHLDTVTITRTGTGIRIR